MLSDHFPLALEGSTYLRYANFDDEKNSEEDVENILNSFPLFISIRFRDSVQPTRHRSNLLFAVGFSDTWSNSPFEASRDLVGMMTERSVR